MAIAHTDPTTVSEASDEIVHWVLAAADAADDKLATDIVIIDVGDALSLTDYFVIASGRNTRQVRAIAEEVEEQLAVLGGPKPLRTEGRDEYRWLLMDYGSFVVHVFEEEARAFYDLDRLWGDLPRVQRPEPIERSKAG
jgi:ribosome-associated protein